MRLGYKSEFLPLLHKVAIWFPVVTFLCNRCEARPRIQRVGLAEQQEWSRVQFHFHTASKATKIHPCSHMTIDCKLILQFKSNDFQFTVCIIDPKENRAEVSPPKSSSLPIITFIRLWSARCLSEQTPWNTANDVASWNKWNTNVLPCVGLTLWQLSPCNSEIERGLN